MANFTVVYDSNALHPAPLRDLLMRLALTDLFRARWTEDIHIEWKGLCDSAHNTAVFML